MAKRHKPHLINFVLGIFCLVLAVFLAYQLSQPTTITHSSGGATIPLGNSSSITKPGEIQGTNATNTQNYSPQSAGSVTANQLNTLPL